MTTRKYIWNFNYGSQSMQFYIWASSLTEAKIQLVTRIKSDDSLSFIWNQPTETFTWTNRYSNPGEMTWRNVTSQTKSLADLLECQIPYCVQLPPSNQTWGYSIHP